MSEEQLKKLMITPLSNFDIHKYLPNVPIIKYEELGDYENIIELLPNYKSAIIILVQQKENVGHWVALIRDNKKILFFCSYGYKPDKHLLWTQKYLRRGLGQNEPLLSHLLNKAVDDGYNVIFNTTVYQDRENKMISTCGRHVVNVIKYILSNKNSTEKDYYNHIQQLCKKYHENADAVICREVP